MPSASLKDAFYRIPALIAARSCDQYDLPLVVCADDTPHYKRGPLHITHISRVGQLGLGARSWVDIVGIYGCCSLTRTTHGALGGELLHSHCSGRKPNARSSTDR